MGGDLGDVFRECQGRQRTDVGFMGHDFILTCAFYAGEPIWFLANLHRRIQSLSVTPASTGQPLEAIFT